MSGPRQTTRCKRQTCRMQLAAHLASARGQLCPDGKGVFRVQDQQTTRVSASLSEDDIGTLEEIFAFVKQLSVGMAHGEVAKVRRRIVTSPRFAKVAQITQNMRASLNRRSKDGTP